MDDLVRIKRLVLRGRMRFSAKAGDELRMDALETSDVVESILNAQYITKTLRSRGPGRGEKLYVITSFNYTGQLIYSKGKIAREDDREYFYFLVFAKCSRYSD